MVWSHRWSSKGLWPPVQHFCGLMGRCARKVGLRALHCSLRGFLARSADFHPCYENPLARFGSFPSGLPLLCYSLISGFLTRM
jgi:hypothetical protein